MTFSLKLFIWFITSSTFTHGYHQIVNELADFVANNKTFAHQLNLTFIEAGYGPHSESPVSYTIMYETFDEWLTQAPNVTNFLFNDIIIFSNTLTGAKLCKTTKINNWFGSYLDQYNTYLNSYNSTDTLNWWFESPLINMSEYIIPYPNGYQSFNQFFARYIKPEARPIYKPNNNNYVTAPNDGLVKYISTPNGLSINNTQFHIKGVNYNLSKILSTDDATILNKYENGTVIQIYLRTFDYHRYHSPISGKVLDLISIPGLYYYSPVFAEKIFQLIILEWPEYNNRGIMYLEHKESNTKVIFVAIGVVDVSSVNWNATAGDTLTKGQGIGHFEVGGSTTLLIFENNAVEKILVQRDRTIKMGQPVVVLKNPNN